MCDHIRMIEQGKVVFAGTVEDFDNYIIPNSLLVTLVAPPAVEDLMALPGIVKTEELGSNRYRLHFSDSHEIAERVVETSVMKGWRLTDITTEKSSLDTIFAELSKKS